MEGESQGGRKGRERGEREGGRIGKLGFQQGWVQPCQGGQEGPWPRWDLSCGLSLLSPSLDPLGPVALQAARGTLFCCSNVAGHQGNARQFSAAPGYKQSPLSAHVRA